jgi:t-SNARE complex subunit (syntaxin)
MCQEVKDKYSEVLALERSIADLNQMFLDFALLIEQQGEMLDQIEFQVKEATDFVDQANVELAASVELQIGLRKKQCMCMLLGLLIVGAIGTIIYVLLKH